MDITCTFGVPEENDNVKRVYDFCPERVLYIGNTNFNYKSYYKDTKVSRCQGGMEVGSNDRICVGKEIHSAIYGGCEVILTGMCKGGLVGAWIKMRD